MISSRARSSQFSPLSLRPALTRSLDIRARSMAATRAEALGHTAGSRSRGNTNRVRRIANCFTRVRSSYSARSMSVKERDRTRASTTGRRWRARWRAARSSLVWRLRASRPDQPGPTRAVRRVERDARRRTRASSDHLSLRAPTPAVTGARSRTRGTGQRCRRIGGQQVPGRAVSSRSFARGVRMARSRLAARCSIDQESAVD